MNDREQWVLQFCHSYYGPFADCARQYAALFKNSDYRVTTVYLSGEPSEEVERGSASDEVIFLGYRSEDIRGLKIRAIRDLARIARQRNYRFCIAHRFKPIYIALLATKLPVVGIHHSFRLYKNWNRRFVVNRFRKRLLLLAVSDAVRDEIRVHLRDWPESRIQRLYNRVDVDAVRMEQVSSDEARQALGLPSDAWVIGNVGRLHPDKDQATLIRAFAKALPMLPGNAVLCILGEGRLEAELKQLAADLGVGSHVHFAGQIPQARRYFRAFDVFALSSDREPFGMVLIEAMAAGVPLVCSDCGGGGEVVEGAGMLFPFGNEEALAQCLAATANATAVEIKSAAQAAENKLQTLFSDRAATEKFFTLLKQSRLLEG